MNEPSPWAVRRATLEDLENVHAFLTPFMSGKHILPRSIDELRQLREACDKPLSLQILGWLETDLDKTEIESVAGLAVYPLVSLMSATEAMRQNFARLVEDKSTKHLPQPVTSMADFKAFIGFSDIEELQNKHLIQRVESPFS